MTEAEKAFFKDIHARQQIGYKLIEQDRKRQIRATVTTEAIQCFDIAAKIAIRDLPMRPTSGLVEFYKAMAKSRK